MARRGKDYRPPSSPEPGEAAALGGRGGSQAGWGEAVLRADEQASGLQALWELGGRNSRQGAVPASERADGRCLGCRRLQGGGASPA